MPAEKPAVFCEMVPEIEYRDGVFYVIDRCGGTVFRRCYLPHVFLAALRRANQVSDEFHESCANVVKLAKGGRGRH